MTEIHTRYQVSNGSLICHKNDSNSKFKIVSILFTIHFCTNWTSIKVLLFGMDRIININNGIIETLKIELDAAKENTDGQERNMHNLVES